MSDRFASFDDLVDYIRDLAYFAQVGLLDLSPMISTRDDFCHDLVSAASSLFKLGIEHDVVVQQLSDAKLTLSAYVD